MLVTSVTTVISFFANMSSEFIGIVTFGTYAGRWCFPRPPFHPPAPFCTHLRGGHVCPSKGGWQGAPAARVASNDCGGYSLVLAGLLVVVNFLFVVTYFPSVVYYHHVVLKDTTFCGYFKDKPDPKPYSPRQEPATETEEHTSSGAGAQSLEVDAR